MKRLLAGLKQHYGQGTHWESAIRVPELIADPDVISQLADGWIGAQGHVRPYKQHTRIYVALEFFYPSAMANYRLVDAEIEQFIDTVIELCEALNQWLFSRLLQSYEHLVCGAAP